MWGGLHGLNHQAIIREHRRGDAVVIRFVESYLPGMCDDWVLGSADVAQVRAAEQFCFTMAFFYLCSQVTIVCVFLTGMHKGLCKGSLVAVLIWAKAGKAGCLGQSTGRDWV
jgi:hypothetical protein